jgi:CRP/FNR family transcriptional activator FtrB
MVPALTTYPSDNKTPPSAAHEALQGIIWLRQVPASTLHVLATQAVLHRVPAGSLLFEQAETPAFAQVLLAGSIELLGVRDRVETLVELLRPVDLIIPAAVLGGQPYLMRARVYEAAHLLLVPAEAFRGAVGSDLALSRAILGCMAAQFRRQVRLQKNLKLRSTEERVGCYLVSLLGSSDTDITLRLPVEKHLIASQLGMTRETFSRALSGMARFGMFVRGDTIQVANAAAARARFPLDPLIDGPEPIMPLQDRKA